MLAQLPVERLSVEAEDSRRRGFIAGHGAQRAGDVIAFDLGQASAGDRARS